jgi:hypothetical protein
VIAVVEAADRHEPFAILAAQPGLVEVVAVAAGQAGNVELDPHSRLLLGHLRFSRHVGQELGAGQRDRAVDRLLRVVVVGLHHGEGDQAGGSRADQAGSDP